MATNPNKMKEKKPSMIKRTNKLRKKSYSTEASSLEASNIKQKVKSQQLLSQDLCKNEEGG